VIVKIISTVLGTEVLVNISYYYFENKGVSYSVLYFVTRTNTVL
jgi:hypothetical protein